MFPGCTIKSKTPLDQIKSPFSCRPWILELGAFIIFLEFAEYLQRAARTERGWRTQRVCSWRGRGAWGLEEKAPTLEPLLVGAQLPESTMWATWNMGTFIPGPFQDFPPPHTHSSPQLQEPDEAKLTVFKITPGFRVQLGVTAGSLPHTQPAGVQALFPWEEDPCSSPSLACPTALKPLLWL